MKKWLIGSLTLAALLLLTAYIVIPAKFTVSNTVLLKANPRGTYRCLTDDSKWEKLFGKKVGENSFEYNNNIFKVNQKLLEGIEVIIKGKDSSIASVIELLPLNNDSSGIKWTTTIENSSNPFKKIQQYFTAHSIHNSITIMLDSMKCFLEKEENIYGVNVQRTKVKDTLLVATKNTFSNYPSIENVYTLISMLRNYIKANDAVETGYPMLNVRTSDSIHFETMVALPVNKFLNNHERILHKEMVPGNILVTEAKGGLYNVAKAFNSLKDYVEDHQLQSPAIPFESLIIDRLHEPDTTKWITKIYYPIY